MSEPFDPDKYVAKLKAQQAGGSSGSFDPDAYVAKLKAKETIQPAPEKKPGVLDYAANAIGLTSVPDELRMLADPRTKAGTVLQKFGQGASMGLTDEASGVFGVMDELARRERAALGFDPKDGDNVPVIDSKRPLAQALLERYRMERNDTRGDLKKADDANPKLARAADLAGALAIPIPGPGKAAKGAKFLSRMLPYAMQGLGIGATSAAGNSEADLTKGEIGKFIGDVAIGGGSGALTSSILGPSVEKGAEGAAKYLKKAAASNAFKAMNGMAKISNKARNMGFESPEEMERLGRFALDNKLIPFSGDAEEIASRANAVRSEAGQKIGSIVDDADKVTKLTPMAGADVPKSVHPFYREQAAQAGQLIEPVGFDYSRAENAALTSMKGQTAVADDASAEAKKFVEQIGKQSKLTPGKFAGARPLKTDAQEAVNFGDTAKLNQRVYRKAVQAFTGDMQDQVGEVSGPEALAALKSANGVFGNAADVGEFATDAATRNGQHKYKNAIANALMFLGSGAPGAALGSPEATVGGMALLGATKFLNNPGHMAHIDDALGSGLAQHGGAMAKGAAKLSAAQAKAIADYLRNSRQ